MQLVKRPHDRIDELEEKISEQEEIIKLLLSLPTISREINDNEESQTQAYWNS